MEKNINTDSGKYRDYSGDIGSVVDVYRDIDLNGDGETDHIFRQVSGDNECFYHIRFSDGKEIQTPCFTTVVNEGELIEFHDTDDDGVDEILISHYTFGTGGASIWNSWLYYWNENEWASICLDDLESDCKHVSLDFTDDGIILLLDHGYKNGGNQYFDYEGVVTDINWPSLNIASRSKETAKKYWPVEYSLQSS